MSGSVGCNLWIEPKLWGSVALVGGFVQSLAGGVWGVALRFVGVFASFVQSAARKQSSYTSVLRHWGAFGLFFVAILDGSPMPTFGGLDILTAILAARHREPWYLYAGVAAAGSVIGAYLTFRMARRAGSAYLQKKFGERRVSKLLKYFERWGTGTLVVSALIPFPFPTSAFFAIAGVLDYPVGTFLIVVALARSARYAAIAAIASYYGRHFIRVLQHPDRYLGWISFIAGVVALLIVAAILLRRRLEVVNGRS